MCYHPWVGLDISPQGEFKPCCKYKDVLGTSFSEYEANPALEQLRQDFQNGVQNPGCYRCWKDEAAGLPSKRTLDNEYVFNKQAPELNGIKVLGLASGNTCNLACRTCSSYASSRWATESKKLAEKFPDITIFEHQQFYQDFEFRKELLSRLGDVMHVEFAGGEPFYAKAASHMELLLYLMNECDPSQITLHYITNGTVLPDRKIMETMWPRFKKVDIQLSIDGTRQQFEYTRWPAKWSNVLLTVGKWFEHARTHPNIQLSLSHTVSIFTIHALPDFLVWCDHNRLPKPYLGLVSKPDYFSITVLPEEGKHAIEKKFKNYSMYDDLVPIIQAMWANDDSHLLDLTAKYVKIHDVQRGQSFATTFPETYQLLGEQCQTLYQLY